MMKQCRSSISSASSLSVQFTVNINEMCIIVSVLVLIKIGTKQNEMNKIIMQLLFICMPMLHGCVVIDEGPYIYDDDPYIYEEEIILSLIHI